jgi:hypothetical protein
MINDGLIEEIDSAYRGLSAGLRRSTRGPACTHSIAPDTPWMSHSEEYLSVIKEFLD